MSGATPLLTTATLAPGAVNQFHRQLYCADQLLHHEHLDRHRPEHLRCRRHQLRQRDLSDPDDAEHRGHGGLSDQRRWCPAVR